MCVHALSDKLSYPVLFLIQGNLSELPRPYPSPANENNQAGKIQLLTVMTKQEEEGGWRGQGGVWGGVEMW